MTQLLNNRYNTDTDQGGQSLALAPEQDLGSTNVFACWIVVHVVDSRGWVVGLWPRAVASSLPRV